MPNIATTTISSFLLSGLPIAVFLICGTTNAAPPKVGLNDASARQLSANPITVTATNFGDYSGSSPWYLSVNATGEAVLIVYTRPNPQVVEFTVSLEQLSELKSVASDLVFFDIPGVQGEDALSGYSVSVTISSRFKSNTVTIKNAGRSPVEDVDQLREHIRAIKVRQIVRGWFDHPKAADARPFENALLQQQQ